MFDLKFAAKSMQSHVNERFEIRIVDKDNGIVCKAVYQGVTDPNFSVYMERSIPKMNPPYRIDFWADHNNSKTYDGIVGGINEKDHAWRRILAQPLPEDVKFVDGRYEFSFLHDTAFTDIYTDLTGNKISGADTLLPVSLRVLGAEPYDGKMLEIRVIDKGSGHLVALHRQGRATEGYTAEVLGVLDEETTYQVLAYADVNDDKAFSNGDPSWQTELTSTSTGIAQDLDLGALPRAPIDIGEH